MTTISPVLVPAPAGFPATLRELREAKRLSQSDLARLVYCDHSYISRLESGDRAPSLSTVEGIAKALRLSTPDTNRLRMAAGYMPVADLWLTEAMAALASALAAVPALTPWAHESLAAITGHIERAHTR